MDKARYGEAVAVCQQILAMDPRNDYAVGLLPLLFDKVVMPEQRRWWAGDTPEPARLGWPPLGGLESGAGGPAAGRPQ